MLIEAQVFNFREVGEKSLLDIKNECLVDFAYKLKELLEADKGERHWGVWNYKYFQDCFSSKIKYNTKSIVFEETIYNQEPWSVKDTCMRAYGLEWVEGTEECSGYYRYPRYELPKLTHPEVCTQYVTEKEEKTDIQLENVRKFNEFFGLGEFPFIKITLIRLGNKEHYFYTIHR